MGMYKCLMDSDHVFLLLKACYICTDAYGCQGCLPDVTVVGKPVMDDQELGKSGSVLVHLVDCQPLYTCVHVCVCIHMPLCSRLVLK